MDFPVITFPWLGNGSIIAIIAVIHVIINHAVAIGGSVLMVSVEHKAYKTNTKGLDLFARQLSKWILIITTTLGAMTGVGIWFATTVIQPYAIGSLLRVFHWAWFTEWLVFVSEVVLLLLYFYTWDKWTGSKKKYHIRTGAALCMMSWATMVLITGILAAQLTPGKWVETLSFWDAFFNPTWLPSLLFRTFAAIILGVALITPFVKMSVKEKSDRQMILRIFGKWILFSVPFMFGFGVWYLNSVPVQAKSLIVWASGMSDSTFLVINFIGLLLLFLLGVLLVRAKKEFPVILTLFAAFFSTLLIGEFEMIRENIRKPFVIYNYMYANGVQANQVDMFQKEGYLKHSKWSQVKEITEENKLQAGEQLFQMQCMVCHTVDGWRDSRAMSQRVKGWNKDSIEQYVSTLHQARSFMPPFAGNKKELEAISLYLEKVGSDKSTIQAQKGE